MLSILRDFGRWLWRLLPANPILVRVVYHGGRRTRHFWIRFGYLAVLAAIIFFSVVSSSGANATSLGDLAKNFSQFFKHVALAQLAMVCLLAPIFAATAITQERDSQTYNILLSTPLTNAQIVFGTLMSRMYFVFVLLLAGLPLLCIMTIYGGVTFSEIAFATGLAATAAMVAGALAISISVIRVGTRKTIFSFYLAIGIYLMGLWALSTVDGLIVPEAVPAPGRELRMSWLAAFHPFLALNASLNQTPAPLFSEVAHYGFPLAQLAAYPAESFMVMTLAMSVVLCTACVAFVRASVKEGEPTWYNRLFSRGADERNDESDVLRRKPRNVWANAVAWREANTGASGRSRFLQRMIVIGIGLAGAIVLIVYYAGSDRTAATVATTRNALQAIVAIELGLAMLVATNTAATGLTREKEGGTLDIMLVTPLTSRDILFGKCRGLISFALPMLSVPVLSLLLVFLYDLVTGRMFSAKGPGPVVHWEALIALPIAMVGFIAFASALGLRESVNQRRTVKAVIFGVAWLLGICAVTSACFISIAGTNPEFGAAFMPLSPMTSVFSLIHPEGWLGFDQGMGGQISQTKVNACRFISFVASLVAGGVYWAIAGGLYKNMVRNFDMTIRKQMA
jgi:ABC-type transport system involved in multi-copper enzyme maturation permease subunit